MATNAELTEKLAAATTDLDALNAQLVAAQAETDEVRQQLDEMRAERDELAATGVIRPAPSTVAPDLRDQLLVVQPGDTIDSLAERAGCSVDQLLNTNSRLLDEEARARGAEQAVVRDPETGDAIGVSVFAGSTLTIPAR